MLIDRGLPYLTLVMHSRHWRVYAVSAPTPLVQGAARLTAFGPGSLTLDALRPGNVLVRVRFSRYLTVASGRGCVRPAPGGWTEVRANAAGTVRLDARFSLAAAIGLQAACRDRL